MADRKDPFWALTNGWILCSQSILLRRIQIALTHVSSKEKYEEAMKMIGVYNERCDMAGVQLKSVSDYWRSEKIHDRFQILQSTLPGHFIVSDDCLPYDNCVVRNRSRNGGGDIRHFTSVDEAKEWVEEQYEKDSAKPNKKARPPEVETRSEEPKAKPTAKKPEETKPTRDKTSGGTGPAQPKKKRRPISGMMQELLLEGKLSDGEIWQTVKKELGLEGDKQKSYVAWNRKELIKQGKLK